jgi:chloramphenicol O-acetyltransferase
LYKIINEIQNFKYDIIDGKLIECEKIVPTFSSFNNKKSYFLLYMLKLMMIILNLIVTTLVTMVIGAILGVIAFYNSWLG